MQVKGDLWKTGAGHHKSEGQMSGGAKEETMFEIMECLPSSRQSSMLHIHRSFLFSKPTFQVDMEFDLNC